jgi:dsRNA-specific ribonuclease
MKHLQNIAEYSAYFLIVNLSKNQTLAMLSKAMNLREYLSFSLNNKLPKFDAGLFKAFIGAYYLDDDKSGLDDVYVFLYDNFSNIICLIEYEN